ncbi:MAG: DNA polymerase III subunit delta [Thermodesulfobacteriota bacterium]
MPQYSRNQIDEVLAAIRAGRPAPVYLVFGERFLCQQLAADLTGALLPETGAGELIAIDGDTEDPLETLHSLRTYSLFGGRRVFRVMDTRLFLSKEVAASIWEKAVAARGAGKPAACGRYVSRLLSMLPAADATLPGLIALDGGAWQEAFGFARPEDTGWLAEVQLPAGGARRGEDPASLYLNAMTEGFAPDHILVLVAEAADSKRRLFKHIKEHGVVLDARVESGLSQAAQQEQGAVLADLVLAVMTAHHKEIDKATLRKLLDWTGFHPDAVVMEAEKLALYAGEEDARVTDRHLEAVGVRTREDALFELNEAVGARQLARALLLARRLLEGGLYPLALVAGLRNFLRRLLLVRSLERLTEPRYQAGMAYQAFQRTYLPALKERKAEVAKELPGHPYACYKVFQQAESFSLPRLWLMLEELGEAEFLLKSSRLPPSLVVERTLFSFFLAPRARMKAAG